MLIAVSTIITGPITLSGIFVNVNAEYNGLIHISEVSEGFVKDINDFVKIGETIYCRILEVEEEECKLKLSIKDINYKARKGKGKFKETIAGFSPLKDNLEGWIELKVKEINEQEKNQQ